MTGGKWREWISRDFLRRFGGGEGGGGEGDNEVQSDRNSHAEKWKNYAREGLVMEKKNEDRGKWVGRKI